MTPSLIPSRRARAPYRGRTGAHRKVAPFDTPPSAATQGEVDTVAMQDEGNALAPRTGFFNNPIHAARLSGGEFPRVSSSACRGCISRWVEYMRGAVPRRNRHLHISVRRIKVWAGSDLRIRPSVSVCGNDGKPSEVVLRRTGTEACPYGFISIHGVGF